MNMESKNDAQSVIDAVERLTDPKDWGFPHPHYPHERVRVMLLPNGIKAQSVKPFLDEYLERPRRLKGAATAETLQSFYELVLQHKTLNTVVFASRASNSLTAVIDYHGKGELGSGSTPSFCEHRIEYRFPISQEMKAWRAAGEYRGQNAFAQFLDARRFELIDPLDVEEIPTGCAMHDVLIRALSRDKRDDPKAHRASVFASPDDIMQLVESLSGHSRTKFAEVKTDRFGGMRATIEKEGRIDGDEKIPSLFLVSVSAFVGGAILTLPARIRAQVTDKGLQLAAELVGVDRVLEMAFDDAVKDTAAQTGCRVFRGSPEA
jgi:hypothetical protein